MSSRQPVLVSAVRSPIGRHGGVLSGIRPDDLAALVISEAVRRSGIDPEQLEDVFFGAANQAGEDNRNVARMAALLAGLPLSVAGVTVNRLCGSGLEAVNQAAAAILAGQGDAFVAGGVEHMTRAPYVLAKSATPFGRDVQLFDTTLGWRFTNPRWETTHPAISMGETAENVAERYGISREDQDAFALTSQQRYGAAEAAGAFADERMAIAIPRAKGDPMLVTTDEHPRPETSLEQLARLKPAFRKGGSVTAGNASGINDGAAALVVMDAAAAEARGLRPRARIVSWAVAGVDPLHMGIGPVPATRKALSRAGLSVEDLDCIELNEAFAAQAVACMRELGFDPARVNVHGGAIALGHPLGASGARILTTLLHALERRGGRYGLATMCVGLGQGIATVIERV